MSGAEAGAEAFKARERCGWGEKAESYGLLTGRVSIRLVEPLLDAAGVAAGTHVLDVGTGPGYAGGLPERTRFLGILLDALRACGVADGRAAAPGPDPFRFAGDDEFRGLLRGAGSRRW